MLAKIVLLASLSSLAVGSHYYEDKHSAPQPYRYGYEVKDKEGSQYRHEEGDGHGSVKGSYGYTDDKGIYREVQYVADKQGFRAKINTNEPGTSNQDSAGVEINSNAENVEHHAPLHHVHHQQYTPLHHTHHVPVYKEEVIPVYHKVEVAPIKPSFNNDFHFKEFRNIGNHKYSSGNDFNNYKSFNYNNFSPIHGFSYKPFSFYKNKPSLGFSNHFGSNSGKFNIYNNFGYGNLGSNYGNLDGYKFNEFEKFEDLKNKKYQSNIESFNGLENLGDFNGFDSNNFDNLGRFSNLGSYNNIGGFGNTYGFDGINKDKIEKLIEEAKQKSSQTYSSNPGKFNDNNDFQFKEFRNIGNHKYSSDSDFN